MYMSFDEKDTTDASSSCFSIVPLFHQPALPLLVFQLLYTHISECLLIFLVLDKSPGRHYQPPVLGQEHAGNHWGSCRVLFALHMYCFRLGRSWAECNSPYRARHWISINGSWMTSLLVGRREPFRERTSSLGVCGSKIHTFFFFCRPGWYLTQYYRFFMILNV